MYYFSTIYLYHAVRSHYLTMILTSSWFLLVYPISLLTLKTAPPCPSKDLRGPAPGHPEVYRVNPDLPRPLKRRGPASGSPGQDFRSGSNEVKTDLPCLLRNLRGPAPGHPEVYRVNPDLPRPPYKASRKHTWVLSSVTSLPGCIVCNEVNYLKNLHPTYFQTYGCYCPS
jgi:hypothetical protein